MHSPFCNFIWNDSAVNKMTSNQNCYTVSNYCLSFKLIFYCRQLIFSEPEIIASPASGEDGAIYIIMTDEYYKTGKLQLHLEKLNMTVSVTG